jgi:competence protein ComEC
MTTIILAIHSTLSFKIVFCDVGQGAATLLQMGTYQALIDVGPDTRALACIGNHIPFFDHTIETIIISHNQKDHNGGLYPIYKKYKIEHVYGPSPRPSFLAKSQFTEVKDSIQLITNAATIIIHKASQSSNLNESANVVTIQTTLQTIFLTSDINGIELKKLIPKSTTILEIPHHGSKYGLYPDSLNLAHPTLAVISVGKRNTYGHPSKEALDILKAKNIKIWRTDEKGELVVDL